jgi:hypothetical protein
VFFFVYILCVHSHIFPPTKKNNPFTFVPHLFCIYSHN